jgi:hypothetical protein
MKERLEPTAAQTRNREDEEESRKTREATELLVYTSSLAWRSEEQ